MLLRSWSLTPNEGSADSQLDHEKRGISIGKRDASDDTVAHGRVHAGIVVYDQLDFAADSGHRSWPVCCSCWCTKDGC